MKRILIILTIICLILYGFNTMVDKIVYFFNHTQNKEVVEIDIVDGASTGRIAKILEDNGLIFHEIMYVYYLRRNNIKSDLQSGVYHIEPNTAFNDLTYQLKKGSNIKRIEKEKIRVTIPEGYTKEQIASKLEETGIISADEFLSAANNWTGSEWFLKDVPLGENRLEGFLFPDTYQFEEGVDAKTVVNEFLGRFNYAVRNIKDNLQESKTPVLDLIKIASLIEKEAKHNEDRTIISSVIYNRLNKDMLLQIDASILYDIGHRDLITNKELEIDSPYNLYKYKGLPPTPISNPGLASIEGALNPDETDYLYYVVNIDTGFHHFAKTYEEHQSNIKKYYKKSN